MEKHTTYILFSASINRHYIGSTSMNVIERLKKYNSNHKGFTGKANDWEIIYQCTFNNISEARELETKIKGRGAKRFLDELTLLCSCRGDRMGDMDMLHVVVLSFFFMSS